MYPDWTGDPTYPLPGISFADACEQHDRCFYNAGLPGPGGCNILLNIGMQAACNGATAYTNECLDIAGDYMTIVQSSIGKSLYDSDHADAVCAEVALDLDENHCDAQE